MVWLTALSVSLKISELKHEFYGKKLYFYKFFLKVKIGSIDFWFALCNHSVYFAYGGLNEQMNMEASGYTLKLKGKPNRPFSSNHYIAESGDFPS